MNKMKLVIGDWSDDGHGKYKEVIVEVNKTVYEVQEAYKAACALTGISFNHNDDYTDTDRDYREAEKYRICTKYEDSVLTDEVLEVLNKYSCPLDDFVNEEEYVIDFTGLWFWFVGLIIQDLGWRKISEDIPPINGWWNENLNVQFGYGLFY